MKNTTFRKKALLSSVAMLLVALVALGSATFAWFAANPNAFAEGISAKTTASSGLVIRTETDTTWGHEVALFKNQSEQQIVNLQPGSQNQTAASTLIGFEAKAAAPGEDGTGWQRKNDTFTTLTDDKDFYSEKVYFKLSTGSANELTAQVKVTGVELTTVADAHLADAIRVSIADSAGKVLATFAKTDATANGVLSVVDSAVTEGTFTGGLLQTGVTLAADDQIDCLTQAGLTTAEDLQNKYVTVYVYLDGQDSTCYSDNVSAVDATEIVESVKVNFTLVK